MLQRLRADVVGVGEGLGAEGAFQVVRDHAAVFGLQLRFHLQGLDGVHPGHVFGEEGLVLRALHELLVETLAEQRRHREREDGDDRDEAEGNQGELPGVEEHHREEDQQARQVEA